MKKSILFLIVALVFCGCGNQNQPVAEQHDVSKDKSKTSSSEQGIKMPDVSDVKADLTYETLRSGKSEKVYRSQSHEDVNLCVYRVTKEAIWFSFQKENASLPLSRAESNGENTYEFSYAYDKEKDDNTYQLVKDGKRKGKITLSGESAKIQIQGDKGETGLGYEGILKGQKQKQEIKVCDLLKCTSDFFSVRASIFQYNRKYVKIGKVRGADQVLFVEANPSNSSLPCDEEEKKYYKMGNVTFFSTIKECDTELGIPIQTSDEQRSYQYKDFEIVISFKNDCVSGMGIYRNSRTEALKVYQDGEFMMQGCRIIKYEGNYDGEQLVLPGDAVGIAKNSFKLEKNPGGTEFKKYKKNPDGTNVKKLSICIPQKVYLEPLAFSSCGPMEITFEEGRMEIEPGAFCNAGRIAEYGRKIRLPQTVERICEMSFEQPMGTSGMVQVSLNQGLKRIDKRALRGVHFDKLPEQLEQLGDECIYISHPEEKLKISKSLKKIGINAISYGSEMKNGGVEVSKENPHFKSDENGWLYSKDGRVLYLAFAYREYIHVPNHVKKIKCDLQEGPEGNRKQPLIILPEALK